VAGGRSRRKVNGRCVKPTATNAKRKHCIRKPSVHGSITRTGKTGANAFTFTGNLGEHKLAPGTYQLTAAPTGRTSQTTKFTIKR
jgi:hypothetical protein